MPITQITLDGGEQPVLIDAEPALPFNNKLAAKYHLRRGQEGERCKDCAHHYTNEFANVYHKCNQLPATRGPGTDIRVGWDACERFAPKYDITTRVIPATPDAVYEYAETHGGRVLYTLEG